MNIFRRLGNLLFAWDTVYEYHYNEKRDEESMLKFSAKARWERLASVSDRYKKLGFFPMPLTYEMFECYQVFLEPSDELIAEWPERNLRGLRWEADAGSCWEIEELEKPKGERNEWIQADPKKYARYEPK